MRQTITVFSILGLAFCARLDNKYLPPTVAQTARSGPSQGSKSTPSRQSAAPIKAPTTSPVPILRYENNNDGSGNYQYAYETGNGIQANEQGFLNNPGSEDEAETVHGAYSYTAPDGRQYSLHYVADENGFQPSGDHLPTSPPIPEEIQRSLERIQSEEEGKQEPQAYTGSYQYSGPQQYLPPK